MFVEKLVDLPSMTQDSLERRDANGHTALYFAVAAGNLKAAKVMVEKHPGLPQIRTYDKVAPILQAALGGHKDLLQYLCEVTMDEEPSPFRGRDGVTLFNYTITADFYDIALHLFQLYPEVAIAKDNYGESALDFLARKSSSFESGCNLGFWQSCIYPFVRIQPSLSLKPREVRDLEDPKEAGQTPHHQYIFTASKSSVLQRLKSILWDVTTYLVPLYKKVYCLKLMHYDAVELVKGVCGEIARLRNQFAINDLVDAPFVVAAEYGTLEIFETLHDYFPKLIQVNFKDSRTVLHICIAHRQEKIFTYLKGIGAFYNLLRDFKDKSGNNILHTAARRSPRQKLKTVSGAALQVQRELQWYKAVEKITRPNYRNLLNTEEKPRTPRDIFTDEHDCLFEKGEKWMKEMALSCSFVATIIATVVFTAAFTVPGGNKSDTGTPIFQKNIFLVLFAISDALALISSLTSVLVFLSVLTSRYAEEDFLESLPRKLIIGLATLFFSIASMAIAFSSTYFIMFSNGFEWIAALVASLTCLPAILFAVLQLPIFAEIVRSTYGADVLFRQL